MSLFCCIRPDGSRSGNQSESRANIISSEDYLLPGGEWDPSVSSSPGHKGNRRGITRSGGGSSRKKKSSLREYWTRKFNRSRSSHSSEDLGCGEYEPPIAPASRTLPTIQEFRLLKTVGRGAFGKVMLAVHSETRILYALKVVPKAKITTKKQVDQILAECHILKSIRHPYCIGLQYAFQSDDFLFYVFEFAAGGMLFYHLRKDGKFTEPRARFYFGEIILALDYLHSFGIIFRDLKPENCMLAESGHIVLTDFGSAKMLEVSEKTSTIAGTPQYIAPEVLRGEPYSFSADWWSCGILLYEMLTGKTPFYSADRVELYRLVLRGCFTLPRGVSPRATSLMYRLINKNQTKRIGCDCGSCQFHSASDIKQHKFFCKLPMDSDEEGQYTIEEAERQWERDAQESMRRSRTSSFLNTAGSFIRTVSISAKRMSMAVSPYLGAPCDWTWEELEGRNVTPPFKPTLNGPTDLRNFDPTLTCIPPTLSDLVTTERSLHVEDFNYVAPEDLHSLKNSKNSAAIPVKNEVGGGVTTVEVMSSARSISPAPSQPPQQTLENSTDEEKVLNSRGKAVATPAGQEGLFVEGKLDRNLAPQVVVTADVNAAS